MRFRLLLVITSVGMVACAPKPAPAPPQDTAADSKAGLTNPGKLVIATGWGGTNGFSLERPGPVPP